MTSPGKVHDPLFHFETHFPERLSRLHLNQPEVASHPVHRKNKKSRAARQGARYKTQPITFDEIQEVDEDNIKEEDKVVELRTQFAAFSKSMDGLLPKHKSKIVGETIQEIVDDTGCSAKQVRPKMSSIGRVQSDTAEIRLQQSDDANKENKENDPNGNSKPDAPNMPLGLPPSGPNTRRQRTTAKAKKRQMQADVNGGGDTGT